MVFEDVASQLLKDLVTPVRLERIERGERQQQITK